MLSSAPCGTDFLILAPAKSNHIGTINKPPSGGFYCWSPHAHQSREAARCAAVNPHRRRHHSRLLRAVDGFCSRIGVVTAIEAALHADRTLGGLCSMLWLKSTDWDFDDAELGAVVVTQQWDLQYLF